MKILSPFRAAPALIGLAALALAGALGPAQAAVKVVVQGTAHQALFAVSFDGPRGVAVGAAGEVQSTEDSGQNWTRSTLPTELSLLGVHVDSARSIAVGQSGLVFIKAAGGEWQKVDAGIAKRLFSVSANVAGLVVAVGEFGGLILSEDAGRSWHTLTIDWAQFGTEGGAEPHLYGVTVEADGAVTVVGEFGLVLRSTDRGRSWGLQSKATASLFAVDIRDNGTGFAVGQDGYALKTSDHGATWNCIDVGSKAILTGITSTADGRVAISAMREMVVSKDDGNSWQRVESPEVTTMWYVGVALPDSNGPVLVGQTGRIVRVGS